MGVNGRPWGYMTCNSSNTYLLSFENSFLAKCKSPLASAWLVFPMLLLIFCPWLSGMGGVSGDLRGCGFSVGGDNAFGTFPALNFSVSSSCSSSVTRF